MKMIGLRCIVLVLLMIGFSGCTHSVVPRSVLIEANQLPIVKTGNSVSVKILQTTAPKEFIIMRQGFDKYVVNAAELNNKASASLVDMLKKNNVALADNASKKLSIAVVDAECLIKDFSFQFKCLLNVKAQAGDKIERVFIGQDYGARYDVSITEAVNNALVEMLKEKEFLQYLTE
jgi:hypothetical protein